MRGGESGSQRTPVSDRAYMRTHLLLERELMHLNWDALHTVFICICICRPATEIPLKRRVYRPQNRICTLLTLLFFKQRGKRKLMSIKNRFPLKKWRVSYVQVVHGIVLVVSNCIDSSISMRKRGSGALESVRYEAYSHSYFNSLSSAAMRYTPTQGNSERLSWSILCSYVITYCN